MRNRRRFAFLPVFRMIPGLIFGTVFIFLIAHSFLPHTINAYKRERAMTAWPERTAEVVRSEIQEGRSSYRLEVSYAYEVEGKSYRGNTFYPNQTFLVLKSITEKRPLLERYAKGTRHAVLVNPDNPAESVLKPEKPVSPFRAFFPLSLFAVFLIFFVAIFIGGALKSTDHAGEFGSPPRKAKTPFAVFLFLLVWGGGFLAAGIVTLRPIVFPLDTSGWQPVEAVVVKSDIRTGTTRSSRGRRTTTYHPYIAYTYTVGDQTYDNDRINRYGTPQGRNESERLTQDYSVGKKITVYVNPEAPQESVIDREGGRSVMQIVMGGIAFLVGSVAFLGTLIVLLKRITGDRVEADFSTPETLLTDASSYDLGRSLPRPAQELGRPLRQVTRQRLGLLTVFAIFWNGMIIAILVNSGVGRRPFTWDQLFLVPFVVVGLVLIVQAVRAALQQLFAPKLEVLLMEGRLEAGQTVQFAYRVIGDAQKLRNLVFRLQCGSAANRNRSRWERHAVPMDIPVFQTENPVAIQGGSFRVTLPASYGAAMSTWILAVKGETTTLANLSENYLL